MKNKKPELLAPAGDWPSLNAAIESGADSIYFGVKGLNMRHLASNFDALELSKIMQLLHKNNMKGYLALNVIVMDENIKKVAAILKTAKEAKVDAVILWDMAVLLIAKDLGMRIHLSTQASVSNVKALEAYSNLGIKRVVLARECTLKDIKKIKAEAQKKRIDCEIETFIHGAMCISISGRCFMSQYSHGKSANKGQCVQLCRREYLVRDAEEEVEFVLGKDYVLSPKDLCSIDFLDQLINAKIDSFKIEGRMRAPEYIREVTSVYREAIDLCFQKKFNEKVRTQLRKRLKSVYNRGFSTGFYFGQPKEDYSSGTEHSFEKIYVGKVTRFFKKISVGEICLQSSSLKKGDKILFIGKNTPADSCEVNEIQHDGKFVKKAEKGQTVGIKLPFVVKPRDKMFIWRGKEV